MKRITAFAIAGTMIGALAAAPAFAQQQQQWGQQQFSQVPERAIEPQFLAQIQQGLQQQGYYRGQIDGLYGPLTHEALTQYQMAQGLQPTGQLNNQTVAAMMDPDRQQAMAPEQQAMAPEQQPLAAEEPVRPTPGFGAVEQMAEDPRIPPEPGQIEQLRNERMSSPNIVGQRVPERPETGAAAPEATREELRQPEFR